MSHFLPLCEMAQVLPSVSSATFDAQYHEVIAISPCVVLCDSQSSQGMARSQSAGQSRLQRKQLAIRLICSQSCVSGEYIFLAGFTMLRL
jgi:hypothetical protein